METTEQLKLYTALQQYGTLWERIAKDSGEHQKEDIETEALLFVITKWKKAVFGAFDINDTEHRKYLYGAMRNKFVKFSEKNIKYAERIDHPAKNTMDESIHPILLGLKASDTYEPLQYIINKEDEQEQSSALQEKIKQHGFSKLVAFWTLFAALPEQRKAQLAEIMKMSESWLFCCISFAKLLHDRQQTLFDGVEQAPVAKQLGSWRKFKLNRQTLKSTPVLDRQLNLFQ